MDKGLFGEAERKWRRGKGYKGRKAKGGGLIIERQPKFPSLLRRHDSVMDAPRIALTVKSYFENKHRNSHDFEI